MRFRRHQAARHFNAFEFARQFGSCYRLPCYLLSSFGAGDRKQPIHMQRFIFVRQVVADKQRGSEVRF